MQNSLQAPETTIELSRNPLRIYGIDSRDEWIVVRDRHDGRVQLAMTRKYFLDDVWNALVAAGAVPATAMTQVPSEASRHRGLKPSPQRGKRPRSPAWDLGLRSEGMKAST